MKLDLFDSIRSASDWFRFRDMEQQALTMYFLVNHALPEVAQYVLYKIELPLDLLHFDQMIESDGLLIDSKSISLV